LPDDRPQYQVTVTLIQETCTDTGPGDVEVATAHATWAALGFVPTELPSLSKGAWLFPS
jgi:hypothetical protein